MAIVHRPLGALASMIAPLEAPLLDPDVAPLDVAPLDVAPEPVPDPLDAPLPVPEPAPLPDPDADPDVELPLPPLLADPEEPPSSGAAPCPDEFEPLPHPAPTAQAKAASESDATKVDRRMMILLNHGRPAPRGTGSSISRPHPAVSLPQVAAARGSVRTFVVSGSHLRLRFSSVEHSGTARPLLAPSVP
jgi:hypothetical protein